MKNERDYKISELNILPSEVPKNISFDHFLRNLESIAETCGTSVLAVVHARRQYKCVSMEDFKKVLTDE